LDFLTKRQNKREKLVKIKSGPHTKKIGIIKMNNYKVHVQFSLRIDAKNRNEVESIINKLNIPNQQITNHQITKFTKMNTNCLQCGKELINRTASAKFCNNICRSANFYEKG